MKEYSEYYPDMWCIVAGKDNIKRLVVGWYQGYKCISRWKLSSKVEYMKTGNHGRTNFFFSDNSIYICDKNKWGIDLTASRNIFNVIMDNDMKPLSLAESKIKRKK